MTDKTDPRPANNIRKGILICEADANNERKVTGKANPWPVSERQTNVMIRNADITKEINETGEASLQLMKEIRAKGVNCNTVSKSNIGLTDRMNPQQSEGTREGVIIHNADPNQETNVSGEATPQPASEIRTRGVPICKVDSTNETSDAGKTRPEPVNEVRTRMAILKSETIRVYRLHAANEIQANVVTRKANLNNKTKVTGEANPRPASEIKAKVEICRTDPKCEM
jgi:hypothetical protein